MRKLRIGIFMGGNSIEREVSFNSGRTIYDHLDTQLYIPVLLFQTPDAKLYLLAWKFMHRGKIADFEHRLPTESKLISWSELNNLVDIVFIAAHGANVEDGRLQAMLTFLDIPYTGSNIYASALCMHKWEQKKIVQALGIAVPHGIHYHAAAVAALTKNQLEDDLQKHKLLFPLIVKPVSGGSSLGVHRVNIFDALFPAIQAASHIEVRPQGVLIEEQLQGMEFSCSLLYDYQLQRWMPLSLTEIMPHATKGFLCYDQKYMPGSAIKHTPARCSPVVTDAIHTTCTRLLDALDVQTMARIDGFYTTDNRIVIIDVNPICGMDPASFLFREAAQHGLNHRAVINHIIATELHAYGMHTSVYIQKEREMQVSQKTRLRVAVLFGGNNHEREISLASGRNVIYKLPSELYEPIPIFISSTLRLYHIDQQLLIKNRTAEIEAALQNTAALAIDTLPSLVDFVFIALHGGCGENGVIQGTLETLGIPYNGSSILTSARCIDKFKTGNYLRAAGFDVPAAYMMHATEYHLDADAVCARIMQQICFPLIVKPHDDGCSMLVQKASTLSELHAAIKAIINDNKSYVLIEEYITGMELTVGCIGNDTITVLPPSMVMRANGILSVQEKFLPGAGENQTPAPLDVATTLFVQETIKQVYRTLNCRGYARIDCFYQTAEISPTGNERLVIIEVNTLPGLTPATCFFHQAAEIGMRPSELLSTIIELGLIEHQHLTKQNLQRRQQEVHNASSDSITYSNNYHHTFP